MVTSQSLHAIDCEFFYVIDILVMSWKQITDNNKKGIIVSASQMGMFGEILHGTSSCKSPYSY